MDFLKEVFEERKKYFENLEEYCEEIKKIIKTLVPGAKIYLFGSIIRNEFSIGLSDIDIAIVSDKFSDRDKKLKIFGILTKRFFYSPFEFHLLTKEQWDFYRRFIGKDKKEIR